MKKKFILSLVLSVALLGFSGIANAITLTERDELNNATPGTQKVGLGTLMRSQLAVGEVILETGDTSLQTAQTILCSVEPSGDTGYVRKFSGAGGGDSLALQNCNPGQIINFAFVSDGGQSWVITPDTSSGFKAITFDDAGDVATLQFKNTSIGWVVLGTADVSSGPILTAPDGTSDPGFK